MQLNPHIFKEYDIRGIVGKDIDESIFNLIGKAFGTYLQNSKRKKVVVGCDNRISSKALKSAFISGLVSTGCEATDVGLATSPMTYFAACNYDFDASASITASHNPKEYNGVKFTFEDAKAVYGEMIQELRRIIESNKFAKGTGTVHKKEILDDYLDMLKSKIKLAKKIPVILDCGNGTAGIFVRKLFTDLGCEADVLFEEPDGNFPNHLPDPTKPEFLTELIERCKKEKKVGIAFDGDVDRVGMVSEQGEIIWGDKLMILFSREILSKNPHAKILFEVKCSLALYEEILKHGGRPIVSKTGHSLMKAKLREENALLAGEMSGHMFFADEYYGYDDAVYAALRVLRILAAKNKSISELLSDAPKYFSTPEIRVDCPDEQKFKVVESIKQTLLKKYPNSITVDGIRVVYPDGWALVRASNTQPKIILRFEAKTAQRLEEIKAEIVQEIKKFPKVII